MMKQKQNTYKPSGGERKTLTISAVTMIAFFLFVAIATKGSLTYYAIPHGILGLAVVAVLPLLNAVPRTLVRLLAILAVIGAITAIGMTIAYLPYYSTYLNYINSAK